MDVGFGYALDVLWSDGEVGCGEFRVVVEGAFVEEDASHCVCGGVRGFELTGQGLDASDFGFFDLGFGGRFGLDAFEFEHQLLGGWRGDVGFDESSSEEGATVAIERVDGVCAVGVAVNLAEVHVDAAGEGSAEGVVHDLKGLEVRGGDWHAVSIGDERGLWRAGFVDEGDAECRGFGNGWDFDFGCGAEPVHEPK